MLPINKISIVIPIYNEEKNIFTLLKRTVSVCQQLNRDYEILLIDDGSSDNSTNILIHMIKEINHRMTVIILNRNYGQHLAIMAGFTYVTGDLIITLDADLQNPPEEIIRLVQKADEGYDVVGTVRQNRQDNYFRKIASYLINRLISRITGKKTSDYGCMLRAYRRHIVDIILHCRENSVFIPILANIFAYTIIEIPVQHDGRKHGKSKYNLIKLVNLMYDLITCLSITPLRLLSIFGSFILLLGCVLLFITIALHIIFDIVWKIEDIFFMLFSVLLIFIGVLFISIGILGEYVGRTYDSVRAHPRYFIQRIIRQQRDTEKEETYL